MFDEKRKLKKCIYFGSNTDIFLYHLTGLLLSHFMIKTKKSKRVWLVYVVSSVLSHLRKMRPWSFVSIRLKVNILSRLFTKPLSDLTSLRLSSVFGGPSVCLIRLTSKVYVTLTRHSVLVTGGCGASTWVHLFTVLDGLGGHGNDYLPTQSSVVFTSRNIHVII